MAAPAARIVLAALLLGSGAAWAEPAQSPNAPSPGAAPTGVRPAPRTPVRREAAPVIRAPAPPRRAPAAAKPPAPAATPVPVPVPDAAPVKPPDAAKGSSTGLPLPRYAALRSDEVNLRSGPGTRYPIDWVYKRRDLPVEIEREFEVWRLVRDQEGTKGWVHQATLAPRRTAVVVGAERVLRRDAKDDAGPVARLKPGVIVRLRSCEANSDWCQTQVQDYRGWMRRTELWGVALNEAIQ